MSPPSSLKKIKQQGHRIDEIHGYRIDEIHGPRIDEIHGYRIDEIGLPGIIKFSSNTGLGIQLILNKPIINFNNDETKL